MRKLVILSIFLLAVGSRVGAQTATVTWTSSRQTMDGFGAADFGIKSIPDSEADTLFSTTKGAGLSLLRVMVPYDGSAPQSPAIMQQAASRGARIFATPLSPPASMKTNGSVKSGGSLLSSSYADYATYLSNYIAAVKNDGITLYAISVQNEPDITAPYASANWTGPQFNSFIKNNLGPTLAAQGQSGTLIMLPEPSSWCGLAAYADATMTDPAARAYVGIVAVHDYSCSPAPYPNLNGKHLWMTETSRTTENFDGSISDGLTWAVDIHKSIVTAGASAWVWWWLDDQDQSKKGDNEVLISSTGGVSKRLYCMGNWSKFVRPGWVRIDATGTDSGSGVFVSAFKEDATGKFAIVVVNEFAQEPTMTFSLAGFSGVTAVTPNVTSSSQNLAAQSNISVSGNAFTATLAANSITTFVGTSGGSQNTPPAAPVMKPPVVR